LDAAAPGPALVAEVKRGDHAHAPAGVSHCLVIQAGADDVVPAAHGRLLYERAAEPRALRLIDGADHRLTEPVHRLEAMARSRDWFAQHLLPGR
jgi:fermentation-respiration switch protein FrsA (DUF1100 family)